MRASRWCGCRTRRRGSAGLQEPITFTLGGDGKRLVVVATEDNLLKGAATQALQNLNLAFGFDELAGIPLPADGEEVRA